MSLIVKTVGRRVEVTNGSGYATGYYIKVTKKRSKVFVLSYFWFAPNIQGFNGGHVGVHNKRM